MISSFLIIQTASLGDVILATALAEKLHKLEPDAAIDILIKKGYESLFNHHPFIRKVLLWDKAHHKYRNLKKLIKEVRCNRYNTIYNLHRFASSGLITIFSKASHTIGFKKNPLSCFFGKSLPHIIGDRHEVDRNASLVVEAGNQIRVKPALYPSNDDFARVAKLVSRPYCVFAPGSLWPTKQLPDQSWIKLCQQIPDKFQGVFIGSKSDYSLAQKIIDDSKTSFINLCGQLSLLESTALISGAEMTYTNDSAPMHLASSVNAPITAFFCSTTPSFGFGPLSDQSYIAETDETLNCRPCGIHGHKECPEKHFRCGTTIITEKFVKN